MQLKDISYHINIFKVSIDLINNYIEKLKEKESFRRITLIIVIHSLDLNFDILNEYTNQKR